MNIQEDSFLFIKWNLKKKEKKIENDREGITLAAFNLNTNYSSATVMI